MLFCCTKVSFRVTTWTSTHSSMILTFVFNPRDLYYRGWTKIIITQLSITGHNRTSTVGLLHSPPSRQCYARWRYRPQSAAAALNSVHNCADFRPSCTGKSISTQATRCGTAISPPRQTLSTTNTKRQFHPRHKLHLSCWVWHCTLLPDLQQTSSDIDLILRKMQLESKRSNQEPTVNEWVEFNFEIWGGSPLLPFLPPPHYSPLLSHPPSIRSRLPLIQVGDLGRSAVSSPAGPGGARPPNNNLVLFELKKASGDSNFMHIFTKNTHKFGKLMA